MKQKYQRSIYSKVNPLASGAVSEYDRTQFTVWSVTVIKALLSICLLITGEKKEVAAINVMSGH